MRKMALFVEGLTEQLFVEKLIKEIAGIHKVRVKVEKMKGPMGLRRLELVSEDKDAGQPYYILIRNCHGDHNVGSDIRDQYDALVKSEYQVIIGVRDLYPRLLEDLPVLMGVGTRSLNFRLKTTPVNVVWIIAQMETEAWFLAEHTHFPRIHPALTPERILKELGIDIINDDMELRAHPAADLHTIYNLEGLSYTKTPLELERTVNSLDFLRIYAELLNVKHLRKLIDAIEGFITTS